MFQLLSKRIKGHTVVRASLAVMLITALGKLAGYVEKIVLAYYFGTSYQTDVYNLIVTIILAVFFFVREIIEPSFLAPFLKGMNNNDPPQSWALFRFFFNLILVFTIVLSVMVLLFPDQVIAVFAPGFRTTETQLATKLLVWAFPASIFLSLTALTNITLNGLKSFALPAMAELLFKASIVLGLIIAYRYIHIYAVVVGLLAGALLKLLFHLVLLFRRIDFSGKVSAAFRSEAWQLSWPLLIGVSFSQVGSLVDNILASYFQEGALSALSYAKKVIDLPVLVFPYILSMVIFPFFSELAVAKQKDQAARLLRKCLHVIFVAFLPLGIFFYLCAFPLIELLFKRGAFDVHSVALTAEPLRYYACGLVFLALETVIVVFYFANANTKIPVLTGIFSVLIRIAVSFLLMGPMGYSAIALGLVVSKVVKNTLLLYQLRGSLDIQFSAGVVQVGKVLGAGLISFLALKAFLIFGPSYRPNTLSRAVFLTEAFVLQYLSFAGALYLVRFCRLQG